MPWYEARIYARVMGPKPAETWKYRQREVAERIARERSAEWNQDPMNGPVWSEVIEIDPPPGLN